MSTLAQLTTPMTVAEATDTIYAALAARGVTTTTWKAGAVVRTLIAGLAIILAAFSALQALIAKSGFLALSEGDWLTLVAFYVYGVTRDPGSFATGFVTPVNAGPGVYVLAIGQLVVNNGTKTYRNTAPVTIPAFGPSIPSSVPIQADELGSASSTAGGTIVNLTAPLPGVSVTNPAALVGNDPENDATLRIRCAEKLGTLSPDGPPDAYAFIARSAKRPDGSLVGVTRTLTVPDGIGGVDVYVASASGGLSGPDVIIVDEAIQTQVVPLAITARTHSATSLPIDVTYELWIPNTNTQTDAQVEAAVSTALTSFLGSRPIGGDVIPPAGGMVYLSAIEAIVGGTVPGTINVAITLPVSDIFVGTFGAPTLGVLTPTAIHRVVGPAL